MDSLDPTLVPAVATSLFALLGLYVRGQYRSWAKAYRRSAWDSGNGDKVRLLMHVTTQDSGACRACRDAHGTVFLPSLTAKKGFSTLRHPCSNPNGCRCLVVGLHGGWPTANRLVETLRRHSRHKPIKLDDDEVLKLFEWPWRGTNNDTTDRVAIQMVQALHLEGTDLEAAIAQYRYVLDRAKSSRDVRLLVPAYRRLAELLQRVGRPHEALEVVERFEKRFSAKQQLLYRPTTDRWDNMPVRKSVVLPGEAAAQPAEAPSLRMRGSGTQATADFWR